MPPKQTGQKREREKEWGEKVKDGRSPPPTPSQTAADLSGFQDFFPKPTGEIDLEKYDLPQGRCALEWWYFNCHLRSKMQTSQQFSLFASFFRQAELESITEEQYQKGGEYEYYDACTWALTNPEKDHYLADSLLDHRACEKLIAHLDPEITGRKCMHAEGPLLELAKKGRVPRPDRLMKGPAKVSKTELDINLDNQCVLKARKPTAADGPRATGAPDRCYHVKLYNPKLATSADLTFTPQRQVIRHGSTGVVNKLFYYYIPRCTVKGTVTARGERHEVEGEGWYDREFGGSRDDAGKKALDAWTWTGVQLSNNSELSLFHIVDIDTQHEKELVAIYTNADGTRIPIRDVQMSYSEMWTSLNTYIEYPMKWKITVPSLELELHLHTAVKHQEFMSVVVSGGGFYEGRMIVNGSHAGKAVSGLAYLERKNHTTYKDTAGLLRNVGRCVKKTLAEMYPYEQDQDWVNRNVLGRHCTGSQNAQRVCDTLFKPVRALIDRGGKAWRSLILVSSLNALSELYFDGRKYIAMSELLHVGSLIIDDIQDESTVRRGGKCVHIEFGTATAINSGTACFFLAPRLSGMDDLPDGPQLKLYKLYFDILRAGHAGQGLDIAGLDYLLPKMVETGDTAEAVEALKAIHVYKTGGAAGTLTAMACTLCEAPPAVAHALERFGVALGLAFQIVDDALNLKGFEGDLKEVGEDIRDGKVTYPIVKGMSRLGKPDRQYIASILEEKTSDHGKIRSVIDKLNAVGAIDDCLVEARNLAEETWELVDAELPDSLPKIMMRTFCLYLTERTF